MELKPSHSVNHISQERCRKKVPATGVESTTVTDATALTGEAGLAGLAAAFLRETRPLPAGVAGLTGLTLVLALLVRPLADETFFATAKMNIQQ